MPRHEDTMLLLTKAKNGDECAKTLLIEQNSPLVKSIIKRYKNKGVEYEDLYQLGCVGFVKAINKFDVSFNVKFSTYAVPLIAGEVKRFLRDDGYIKVSRAVKMLYIKIKKFILSKSAIGGITPSIDEIAKEMNVTVEEVVYALDASRYPISIFEKSGGNGADDDGGQSLLERIGDGENQEKTINYMMLKDMLKSLPEREKKIIILRYFRNLTQSQVAEHLSVSQVQISRIEAKVLQDFKAYFNVKEKKPV